MTDKIFKLENINLSYEDLIVFKNFNIDFHLNSIYLNNYNLSIFK